MKLSAIAVLSLAASAAAFAPKATFGTRQSTSLSMASDKSTSRAAFLQTVGAAAVSSVTLLPNVANAAKYGKLGAGSPEVLDPKDADVDMDILASAEVQKALSAIKGYASAIEEMKATLKADSQADIGAAVSKNLERSQLRTDLNTFNTAFDEDTQRGTDRIIRIIVQDISELEISNKQKPGVPRSQIRLDNLNGKLNKLSKAFGELLAFNRSIPTPAPASAPEPVAE